jgi:hypothetical protein
MVIETARAGRAAALRFITMAARHGRASGPRAPLDRPSQEIPMLLDVRTYTCRPGTIKKHLELYERLGKAPQTRHLGQPLAYMTTETGNPNQYLHIWVYDNAGDREQKRAAMWADKDWLAYTQESAKLGALEAQENRLMNPVGFFPEPGKR